MASALVMMLGGAITYAFAFSGSNYLFSHIIGSDSGEERKRHDKEMEKSEAEKTAWEKNRIQRLDFQNERTQKGRRAEKAIDDANQSMKEYYYATEKQLDSSPTKPTSSDYTPSEDQKNREIAFIICGMALTGFVAWKLK